MITQELIAYVKSELNKGKTREEIQVNLLASGGWNESDLSEVFRTIMPLENTTLNPKQQVSPISPISKDPKASPMSSPETKKSSSRTIPWVTIILAVAFGGLSFIAFYFYRPQILDLPNKATTIFSSLIDQVTDLIQTEKTSIDTENEIPETPVVVAKPITNCGITNSPDRKNPSTYLNDSVLKCLGESVVSCVNAKGIINDDLFPTLFKISNKDDICMFQLSYAEDSTLIDVFGKKLASRSISCPVSIVKIVDESDPNNLVFQNVSVSNLSKYASDIYFYGTLGLFIENNFDQNQIESLGCSGAFIGSVIESYELMKSKI